MPSLEQVELSRRARELGLEKAYELDPQAFAAAMDTARSLSERIPRPTSVSDEPAHILRLANLPRKNAGPAAESP